MAATVIGRVLSGKTRKSYEVKWDSASKDAYVSYAGWISLGKTYSPSEAMSKVGGYLYNK